MTTPNRYAVPLDAVDGVHVNFEDHVRSQATETHPTDAARWGGSLEPAYGDSASGGGGGEGTCDGGGE
jgi:hypothetical protein